MELSHEEKIPTVFLLVPCHEDDTELYTRGEGNANWERGGIHPICPDIIAVDFVFEYSKF